MGRIRELKICPVCKEFVYFGQCQCRTSEFYNPLHYWIGRGLRYEYHYRESSAEDKLMGLEALKGQSLIEIGCAYGEALYHIHRTYPDMDLTGVDLSPTMILKARKLLEGTGIDLLVVDGRTLPFGDNEFDIAYTHATLIHVPPPEVKNYIQEIMRVGKAGRFLESSYGENRFVYYFAHDYGKIFSDLGYRYEVHRVTDPVLQSTVYLVHK